MKRKKETRNQEEKRGEITTASAGCDPVTCNRADEVIQPASGAATIMAFELPYFMCIH